MSDKIGMYNKRFILISADLNNENHSNYINDLKKNKELQNKLDKLETVVSINGLKGGGNMTIQLFGLNGKLLDQWDKLDQSGKWNNKISFDEILKAIDNNKTQIGGSEYFKSEYFRYKYQKYRLKCEKLESELKNGDSMNMDEFRSQ